MASDERWADARRLEAWAGEVRVNLIRLVAVLAFYGHHLVNIFVIRDDPSLQGARDRLRNPLAWRYGVWADVNVASGSGSCVLPAICGTRVART